MAAVSRLGKQIQEVLAGFQRIGAAAALIGGLALAPHRVIRATQDVDLLVDADRAEDAERELTALGYRCLHRSNDAANYLRGDERVDLLYASRPIARQLLERATPRDTPFGELRVVSLEGLIAFKLQGLVNDPRRTQDLEDIRALLRANQDSVRMSEVRQYFQLLDERNCSLKSSPDSTNPPPPLVVAEPRPLSGYAVTPPLDGRDPFEVLDDLMATVEGLCPSWPSRPVFRSKGIMLL
ncbi:MAG: hypothetical protein ABIX37_06325 [Gammaproteobacteria bacterium]